MARLSVCALLAVLVACDGQKLRMVPCNEAADCEANQLCLAKRCEPCGELCQPSETPDAGGEKDAGIDEPDAGEELDAGVEEIDAGVEEVDAGDWDAGIPEPDGGVLSNLDPRVTILTPGSSSRRR